MSPRNKNTPQNTTMDGLIMEELTSSIQTDLENIYTVTFEKFSEVMNSENKFKIMYQKLFLNALNEAIKNIKTQWGK